MKKISRIFGVLVAAMLLGTFIGCDQSFDVKLKAPEVAVNDPVFTGKSVMLSWTPVATGVTITRQEVAEGSKEINLGSYKGSTYYDRISLSNELKAGATYKYRFYNLDGDAFSGDVASRATSATISKEYSCITKEIKIDEAKVVAKGTKLDAYTKDDVTVEEVIDGGTVTVFVSVNDEEASPYIEYKVYSESGSSSSSTIPFTYDRWGGGAKISVYKGWTGNYYGWSDPYEIILGQESFNVNRSSTNGDKDIILSWIGDPTIEYTFSLQTVQVADGENKWTNWSAITPKSVTNDENDHFLAVITQEQMIEYYKGIGITIDPEDPEQKPIDVRAIEFGISGTDADGNKFSGKSTYNLNYWNTTYTYLSDLSAACDKDGIVTVQINGQNIEDLDLYYETDGVITKVDGKPFKTSNSYKFDGDNKLEVGKNYTFYANLKDTSKLASYDGLWGYKPNEVIASCGVYKITITPPESITLSSDDGYYYSGSGDVNVSVEGSSLNWIASFGNNWESTYNSTNYLYNENGEQINLGFNIDNMNWNNKATISTNNNYYGWANPGTYTGNITVYILEKIDGHWDEWSNSWVSTYYKPIETLDIPVKMVVTEAE